MQINTCDDKNADESGSENTNKESATGGVSLTLATHYDHKVFDRKMVDAIARYGWVVRAE